LSVLPSPALRRAVPADVPALAALYADSARRLGPLVYTPVQVAAWAGFGAPTPEFADYVLGAETWIAPDAADAPLGFCGCDDAGEVRSLYVHADHARRGLGTRLLAHVIERAHERGLVHLAAWVTPLSRPVFERAGFVLAETVQAPYRGVMFERYRLERHLG
jgi:putative acetyltransferase